MVEPQQLQVANDLGSEDFTRQAKTEVGGGVDILGVRLELDVQERTITLGLRPVRLAAVVLEQVLEFAVGRTAIGLEPETAAQVVGGSCGERLIARGKGPEQNVFQCLSSNPRAHVWPIGHGDQNRQTLFDQRLAHEVATTTHFVARLRDDALVSKDVQTESAQYFTDAARSHHHAPGTVSAVDNREQANGAQACNYAILAQGKLLWLGAPH